MRLQEIVILATVVTALCGCAHSGIKDGTPAAAGEQSTSAEDSPEISRSAGAAGGVTVLWPRVIERSPSGESTAIAAALQQRVRDLVAEALPGTTVDVRPEPERVCPQAGCLGVSVGVLLLREQDGCAALALVSRPGRSAATLVRWSGDVQLRGASVPFREPPENAVTVSDYTPCGELTGDLAPRDADVVEAIRAAAR